MPSCVHTRHGALAWLSRDVGAPLVRQHWSDPGLPPTSQVPSEVLQLSTGIPKSEMDELISLPLVVAPGTGGEVSTAANPKASS